MTSESRARHASDGLGDTHYVLVIHGTWNAREEGVAKWFQLDESDPANFCNALNHRLANTGLGKAVWRECDDMPKDFGWSGENDHADRLHAAERLCEHVLALRARDPTARIHLVAHSHGGNVTLSFLDRYFKALRKEGERLVAQAVKSASLNPPADGAGEAALTEVFERAVKLGQEGHEWLSESAATEFAHGWAAPSSRHRLGRLVFLGTPFYYKRWRTNLSAWRRCLEVAVNAIVGGIVVALPLALVLAIALVLLAVPAGLLRWGMDLEVPHPGVLPFEWPPWMLGTWIALSMVIAGMEAGRRRDANVYRRQNPAVRKTRVRPTLEALVVHAEQLDEAVMALSTEPMVYAFLQPSLEAMVRPRWWQRMPSEPTATRNSIADIAHRFISSGLVVMKNLALAPLYPLRKLIALVLGGVLTDRLLRVVSAAGFGLPAAEFASAAVRVEPRLEEPEEPIHEVAMEASHWEVTRELAESAPAGTALDRRARYAFLWNRADLRRLVRESPTWKRLRPHLRRILHRSRERPTKVRLRQLQRLCVTLDARTREMMGSVELMHSSYYTNAVVIDAIADFLHRGAAPEERRSTAT